MKIERPDRYSLAIDGRKNSWPWRIDEVVPLRDRVVVHFDSDQWSHYTPEGSRNVICIRPDGTTMWQIEDPGITRVDPAGRPYYDTYFGVWLKEATGELWAACAAMQFIIDQDTGKIIHAELNER